MYSISIKTVGKFNDKQMTLLADGKIIGSARWSSTAVDIKELFEDDDFELNVPELHMKSKVVWIKHFYIEKAYRKRGHSKELITRAFNLIEAERNPDHWIGLLVSPYLDQLRPIRQQKLAEIYGRLGFISNGEDGFMFYRK